MITVTGGYCAFFPEELSQLEHLIRRQWKDEFPLSLSPSLPKCNAVCLSQRARENESNGGNKQANQPRTPDDISIRLEQRKK